MKEAAIQIKGLTKIYKGELGKKDLLGLDNLTLEIPAGDVFAFIGPNGAGKTTTIKLLLRLMYPTRGEVDIFGCSNRSREAMRKVGFLPEQPRMYEYLSGREFLDFIGRLFSLSSTERKTKIDSILETVGLAEKGDLLIRAYSRGMMQRLGLAQALINDPDLLILDEPMASLDPIGRKDFRDLILQLKAAGKTIFFSSHILSDAEMVADRVGILNCGKLVKVADLETLTEKSAKGVEVTVHLDPERRKEIDLPLKEVAVQGAKYTFFLESGQMLFPLLRKVESLQGEVISVLPQKQTLEDFFIAELGRV